MGGSAAALAAGGRTREEEEAGAAGGGGAAVITAPGPAAGLSPHMGPPRLPQRRGRPSPRC